jgi:lysophospholipase L1-like esterase
MKVRLHVALFLLVWGSVTLFQAALTLFADDRFMAYRGWEYARVGAAPDGAPFRPFAVWDDTSYGDLSHMAGPPQLRSYGREVFSVDEYGFRNPPGLLGRGCDVVMVGDSTGVGSQTSDGETLAGLLRGEAGLRVYNNCGIHLYDVLADRRFEAVLPRRVMVVLAERNFRGKTCVPAAITVEPPSGPSPKVPMPIRQVRSAAQLAALLDNGRAFRPWAEPFYKGLLYRLGLFQLPQQVPYRDRRSGMLFYVDGINQHLYADVNRADAAQAVERLAELDRGLRGRGLTLVVVVIPEKETVYHALIPQLRDLDVDSALAEVSSALDRRGIANVNLLPALRDYQARYPEELLYVPDDTHLNATGTRVAFEAIRDRLRRLDGAGLELDWRKER